MRRCAQVSLDAPLRFHHIQQFDAGIAALLPRKVPCLAQITGIDAILLNRSGRFVAGFLESEYDDERFHGGGIIAKSRDSSARSKPQ